LGCIVSRASAGFSCPCHGSRFGPQGEVTKGPAPSALPWLEISLAPDGQLVVDVESRTAPGSKFRV
jgi:Rieske Fe-S protein